MGRNTQYIATLDGDVVVTFEGDMGQSWPELPQIQYERAVTTHRMIPGWNGTSATPGHRVVIDAGFHESLGDVEINLPYISPTTHAALMDLYFDITKFLWSPDAGETIYVVCWQQGRSYEATNHEGFPGHRHGMIRLHVLEEYEGVLVS